MRTRKLIATRNQMLKAATQMSNQIHGLMNASGSVVLKGACRVFDGHLRGLLANNVGLEQIILPVLKALQLTPVGEHPWPLKPPNWLCLSYAYLLSAGARVGITPPPWALPNAGMSPSRGCLV